MTLWKIRRFLMLESRLSSMAFQCRVDEPGAEGFGVKLLKSGACIALPTDTIYGFACDATNQESLEKLYSIKQRNGFKPVAICLADVGDIKFWAKTEHLPCNLLETLLPGPVTLILKSTNRLNKSLVYNHKIGIRIPDYSFIRNLAKGLEKPLALTSANLSNQQSSLKVSEFRDLWGSLGGVFDGGDLTGGDFRRLGSTVIDLSESGSFKIIREGSAGQITREILENKFNLIPVNNL